MTRQFKQKIVSEYHKYVRVWRLLKKPTMTEYKTIAKVTAIGLMVIGAAGFVISLAVKSLI